MKNSHSKRKFLYIRILFLILCLLCFFVFGYCVLQVNILPLKYEIILFAVLILLYSGLFYFLFKRGGIYSKIFSGIILSVCSVFLLVVTTYLNQAYSFFQGTFVKDTDVLRYSVVTLRDSENLKLSSLKGKHIGYLNDDYHEEIASYLSKQISYQEALVDDFSELSKKLLEKEVDAICLEESYLLLVFEEVEGFRDSTNVIASFDVHVENSQESDTISVRDNSFILYISGIDQYGNVDRVRGRSDVNQLAVINTRTNHILLVNTPRDYYVQLAGTTGLKDKLTHAGIYGISKSIQTLENLYGIDISHFLRVNFDTLIKVVDIIGGIDIYSDSEFICFTNRSVHVEKGWNHFNGVQALAYSRERYAYLTGDHHRGQNQQQVITAIVNKMTESNVLISKYHSILNALSGSFQTDVSTSMLTSFIKYQLDDMPSWNLESIAVTGYNSRNYTYSMGTSQQLYVMEPDYKSVEKVKTRIFEVLSE